jgi:hypothetical protein
MAVQFSPDAWLTSLIDSFQDYVLNEINNYVLDDLGNPVGLQAYDVVMEYPESDDLPQASEFTKTIIHFEIDDADNKMLGFGDGVTQTVEAVQPDGSTLLTDYEGRSHVINFDVGVWSTDVSGGTTSRARAYQMLDYILNGKAAKDRCWASTGGVEIRYYNSGRFVKDTINDIRVFRVVGAELEARVYSRNVAATATMLDGEPVENPNLVIGGNVQLID